MKMNGDAYIDRLSIYCPLLNGARRKRADRKVVDRKVGDRKVEVTCVAVKKVL